MAAIHTTIFETPDSNEARKEDSKRLVFYDLDGQRRGNAHEAAAIGRMLKMFSDRLRAVRRSTGGIALAEPFQLLVYGEDGKSNGGPEYRVRVKFRDFRRDAKGMATGPEYAVHTKTVALSELLEPFRYENDEQGRMRFVLDFGRGPVPVHVIDYVRSATGSVLALFLEPHDWDRVRFGTKGSEVAVRVYAVDRTVLRLASPARGAGTAPESLRALRNYERQRSLGDTPIPPGFRFGSLVPVPAGALPSEIVARIEETIEMEPTEPGATVAQISMVARPEEIDSNDDEEHTDDLIAVGDPTEKKAA